MTRLLCFLGRSFSGHLSLSLVLGFHLSNYLAKLFRGAARRGLLRQTLCSLLFVKEAKKASVLLHVHLRTLVGGSIGALATKWNMVAPHDSLAPIQLGVVVVKRYAPLCNIATSMLVDLDATFAKSDADAEDEVFRMLCLKQDHTISAPVHRGQVPPSNKGTTVRIEGPRKSAPDRSLGDPIRNRLLEGSVITTMHATIRIIQVERNVADSLRTESPPKRSKVFDGIRHSDGDGNEIRKCFKRQRYN